MTSEMSSFDDSQTRFSDIRPIIVTRTNQWCMTWLWYKPLQWTLGLQTKTTVGFDCNYGGDCKVNIGEMWLPVLIIIDFSGEWELHVIDNYSRHLLSPDTDEDVNVCRFRLSWHGGRCRPHHMIFTAFVATRTTKSGSGWSERKWKQQQHVSMWCEY